MARRRGRFELRLEAASGRVHAVRFGGFSAIVTGLLAVAAILVAGAGLAVLPSRLSSSLASKEMSVLVSRRVQLGERLRRLAARYEQLDGEIRRVEVLTQRVRSLYGLPDLRGPRPTPPETTVPETAFAAALMHIARLALQEEARLSSTDSLLVSLVLWESEHRAETSSIPALMPIRSADAVPATLFGPTKSPVAEEREFHAGVDFAAPEGTLVYAPAAGVVKWAAEAPPSAGAAWWRLGRTVVVAHGEHFRTIFGHLDRIAVRSGQRIAAGDPLGTVGESGRALSPRLHFEVRRRGEDRAWIAVDPTSVLLELDRLEREFGGALSRRVEIDATEAPPLPAAYAR